MRTRRPRPRKTPPAANRAGRTLGETLIEAVDCPYALLHSASAAAHSAVRCMSLLGGRPHGSRFATPSSRTAPTEKAGVAACGRSSLAAPETRPPTFSRRRHTRDAADRAQGPTPPPTIGSLTRHRWSPPSARETSTRACARLCGAAGRAGIARGRWSQARRP